MRTTTGRDWQARLMGDTASSGAGAYAPANWIGVTTDATAPSAADTTLPGELTGGTFARAQATYAHTTGTATYTLTRAFTADRAALLAKIGIFTASTSGTLAFETMLDNTADMKSGDTLQIVETCSL